MFKRIGLIGVKCKMLIFVPVDTIRTMQKSFNNIVHIVHCALMPTVVVLRKYSYKASSHTRPITCVQRGT